MPASSHPSKILMETLTPLQRLYQIQLKIKKSKVTRLRKHAEVKRLKQSFDRQIQELEYSLYTAATSIWKILNVPLDQLVVEPEVKPDLKINVEDIPIEITQILGDYLGDQDKVKELASDENDFLSLDAFVHTLSLYHYLWSQERTNEFIEFLCQLEGKTFSKFSQCLLISPLIQTFFITVLQEPFQNITTMSTEELKECLLRNLEEYARIIPSFFASLLNRVNDKTDLFYKKFLRNIIINYPIFGLSHPELALFAKDELNQFIEQLDEFFETQEAEELIDKIIKLPHDLCVEPTEEKLKLVYPKYSEITLVNSKAFQKITGTFLHDSPLVYVPFSTSIPITTFESLNSGNLTSTISKLLISTDLVQLQNASNPHDYFQQLVDLSDTYGNPQLDFLINQLEVNLGKTILTFDGLCAMMEKYIDEKDQLNNNDPLIEIAKYSTQNAFLGKLKDIASRITKNTNNFINFLVLEKTISDVCKSSDIPELDIDDYAAFCEQLYKLFPPDIQVSIANCYSQRNIQSILAHKYDLINRVFNDQQLQDFDKKIYNFLQEQKQTILDCNQLDFLQIYKDDPSLLKLFYKEFSLAFQTKMPFNRIAHIHVAYQILNGLLQIQKIGEIGADQIVPFAIMGIVYANPLGLASTYEYLSRFIEPMLSTMSPLDHSQDYSIIQFLATFKFLKEKLNQSEGEPESKDEGSNGNNNDQAD